MESSLTKTVAKNISDSWIPDGEDYILHLGMMKHAVIVARYVPSFGEVFNGKDSWYSISPRSVFPFGEGQEDKRFDNAVDAMAFAEKIILKWLNSIMVDENKSKKLK